MTPGSLVGGYAIERLLGEGGMASVFQARDVQTGEQVALKLLHPNLSNLLAAGQRLEQEARAMTLIAHENVVAVRGFGRLDDGRCYLVMEHLEGATLASHLGSGPLSVPRVIAIARQMAAALAKAHSLGIIHRDLKPTNVFLLQRQGIDVVKMLDFGIAKVTEPLSSPFQTSRGMILGTPAYLAPEVAMEVEVTPKSDLYGLGVILFEMLAGRLPFAGRSPAEVVELHCFAEPPLLRRFNSSVPEPLEALVHACLAKEPAARPTAEGVCEALDGVSRPAQRTLLDLPARSMGSGERALGADVGRLERRLKEEVERRWPAQRPPTLAATLSALDRLERELESVETDLALAESQLSELSPIGNPAALRQRLDEQERQLAAEVGLIEVEASQLQEVSAEIESRASALLSAVIVAGPLDDGALQEVLGTQRLGQVVQALKDEARGVDGDRTRAQLHGRLAQAEEERARVAARRARLDAEEAIARASGFGQIRTLKARIKSLESKAAGIRRSRLSALIQITLDLAISLGGNR